MATLSLGIVADDLSGAAECASHALLRVSRSSVALGSSGSHAAGADGGGADRVIPAPDTASTTDDGRDVDPVVVTVDTDSRRLSPGDAARAVRAAAALVAAAPVVVKKVDSLLRGHVAAEVAALADELHRTPVVAVANPTLGRVVRGGVLHVGGTPLHETDLWAVEPRPAPARVAEALAPLPTVLVPHTTVVLGVAAVSKALAAAAAGGLVAVCDAVTDADLDVVHAAATRTSAPTGTLLVGSGALADAAVRALPDHHPPGRPEATDQTASDLGAQRPSSLFVLLGTRAGGVAGADRAGPTHTPPRRCCCSRRRCSATRPRWPPGSATFPHTGPSSSPSTPPPRPNPPGPATSSRPSPRPSRPTSTATTPPSSPAARPPVPSSTGST